MTGLLVSSQAVAFSHHEANDLGIWDAYARSAILPEFAQSLGMVRYVEVDLFASHTDLLLPSFALPTGNSDNPLSDVGLTLSIRSEDLLSREAGVFAPQFLVQQNQSLERTLVASGLVQDLDQYGSFDVSAVFASQRFSSPSLGTQVANTYAPYYLQEDSFGAGLRVGWEIRPWSSLSVAVGHQSRIDMDTFHEYRGVFAEPGDFDVPATTEVSLAWDVTAKHRLRFAVAHIAYSDIPAQATVALPDRFLSLLGDSNSPEFAWQDLTLWRAGWSYESHPGLAWHVDVSSRQQPLPTSTLLASALAPDAADHAFVVGMTKRTGKSSHFSLRASYAPAEYFVTNAGLGTIPDPDEEQIEFELSWTAAL